MAGVPRGRGARRQVGQLALGAPRRPAAVGKVALAVLLQVLLRYLLGHEGARRAEQEVDVGEG
eukprot:6223810-Prymnesium_polylepis.1